MGQQKRVADVMLFERGPRGIPYAVYLQTSHWKSLRFRIFRLDKNRCVWCNRPGKCVHHRTYERLGREWDADLVTLCTECHQKVHSGAVPVDRPRRKSKKTKQKKWTKEQREHKAERRRRRLEERVGESCSTLIRKYRKSKYDPELVVVRRVLLMESFSDPFRKCIEEKLRRQEVQLAESYCIKP